MGSFSVFFDGQFWIGIATREDEVARVVFGPEPSDAEVLEWVREEFGRLVFLPAATALAKPARAANPKRRQREAQRAMVGERTRSAAQEAWHDALALRKEQAPRTSDRRADDLRYEMRCAKRKKKHRGR